MGRVVVPTAVSVPRGHVRRARLDGRLHDRRAGAAAQPAHCHVQVRLCGLSCIKYSYFKFIL